MLNEQRGHICVSKLPPCDLLLLRNTPTGRLNQPGQKIAFQDCKTATWQPARDQKLWNLNALALESIE